MGEAQLQLVPMSVAYRLVIGVALSVAWTNVALQPLIHAVETDLPSSVVVALMVVAITVPAVLFLRRHALPASVRWDAQGVTHLVAGHVATAIRWEDASIGARREGGSLLVRIVDTRGRSICLVSGARFGTRRQRIEGRCLVDAAELDALVTIARGRARSERLAIRDEDAASRDALLLVLSVIGCVLSLGFGVRLAPVFALGCVVLLWGPWTRLMATLRRPAAVEALLIDTEERGRIRARRLDGSSVLLDVSAASHPDAMLPTRRGFVNAVLDVPKRGAAPSYRAPEMPIAATYVETRDDRVLRFESLRTALVDVIGYGAFFATSIAALLAS